MSSGHTPFRDVVNIWYQHCHDDGEFIFIDRKAREIMYLVASACLSVCRSAFNYTDGLSEVNILKNDPNLKWNIAFSVLLIKGGAMDES